MTKNLTKREQESAAKKAMIFEKATKLFSQYGYEKTTISDICRETGMSVGSIYHFYSGKEGILLQIFMQFGAIENLDEDVEKKAADPLEHIVRFFLHYAVNWENIGADLCSQMYRVFDKAFLNPDNTIRPTDSILSLTCFIETAQRLGTLDRSMEAWDMATYLFTVGRGLLYEWCLRKGSYSLVDSSAALLPRILNTFVPKEGARE